MNYLLDTCVISEFIAHPPNPGVADWVVHSIETALFLSVVTIGEIKRGADRLPPSRRKNELDAWLYEDLLVRFRGRLLVLDLDVILTWGTLVARLELAGRKMPTLDALIAATALRNNLSLVTRNVSDFAQSGVTIVNPWN